EPPGPRRERHAGTYRPRRGRRGVPAATGVARAARAPPRRRVGAHRGAAGGTAAPGRPGGARASGALFARTRLPLRDPGPGRLPQRQPQHPGVPGNQALLSAVRSNPAMTPLAAPQALDAYFLEARCKLLDL